MIVLSRSPRPPLAFSFSLSNRQDRVVWEEYTAQEQGYLSLGDSATRGPTICRRQRLREVSLSLSLSLSRARALAVTRSISVAPSPFPPSLARSVMLCVALSLSSVWFTAVSRGPAIGGPTSARRTRKTGRSTRAVLHISATSLQQLATILMHRTRVAEQLAKLCLQSCPLSRISASRYLFHSSFAHRIKRLIRLSR